MGEGDFMPAGRHRRKYDPKRAQKIKEGGAKADKIRKIANSLHKEQEVPKAEEELLKDLKQIPNKKNKK